MLLPIRFRKRSAAGLSGAPSSLRSSEPAYSEKDNVLYYGFGDDGAGNATSVVPIAGKGAFADLASDQTVGGNKTFSNAPIVPTQASSDNSAKAATTAFVKSQFPSIAGATATKITFNSSGLITGSSSLIASDIPSLTASKISDFDTQVRTSRLDQMAAPTADVSFAGQRITTLSDPSNPSDAATKNYVDNVAQGLSGKLSVLCATTGNITLSGTQTIDGVATGSAARILVKAQTNARENGIYMSDTGAWTRASDMSDSWEFNGAFVFVEQGTLYGSTGWLQTTLNPTVGLSNIAWTQFSGAGSWTAGTGLTLSGTQFSISATYAGQSSITTVGNIDSGTWLGTEIGVFHGGTGAQTPKDARTNLQIENLASVNNADYTIAVSDRRVCYTNLSASRTLTLPLAANVNPGHIVWIESGSQCSPSKKISFAAQGADTLTKPGAFGTPLSDILTAPYNACAFMSDGVNTWYMVANTQGGLGIDTVGTIVNGVWNGTAVAVPYGGTGATALTGLVKGNGASAMTAAVVDVDYVGPTSEINGGTF